jgi:hypothetical protein
MHLEHLFKPLHMRLGLIEMRQKTLLELLVGGLFRHFRQRLHELLFGIIDILQLVHEQVVHGFDVFGKESHCLILFRSGGTQPYRLVVAVTPICSIAGTVANRLFAGLFLEAQQNLMTEQGTLREMEQKAARYTARYRAAKGLESVALRHM